MDFFDKHPWLFAAMAAICGAIVGALVKVLFDHAGKQRKRIGFVVLETSIVQGLDKEGLEVTYHGEPVVRLDSYRISFRNVGNTHLEKIPVVINVTGQVRGKIRYVGPEGLSQWNLPFDSIGAGVKLSLEQQNRRLVFECPLLNERETFFLDFLVANGRGSTPEVLIRAPGLECSSLPETTAFDLLGQVIPLIVASFSPYPNRNDLLSLIAYMATLRKKVDRSNKPVPALPVQSPNLIANHDKESN
jgi:hypothetical protein